MPYARRCLEEKWEFARELRKNPTPAEKALWKKLQCRRLGGWKWKRQAVILGFIVDFYCPQAGVIVEVDGRGKDPKKQAARDQAFKDYDLLVLHFENQAVLSKKRTVLPAIILACDGRREWTHPRLIKAGLPNALKTECPKGHPYDEKNTRWVNSEHGVARQCRACSKIRARTRRNPPTPPI